MIKYANLLIVAFLILGCGSKTKIETPKVTTEKIETAEVKSVMKEAKTVTKAPSLPAGFKEEKN